MTTDSVPPALGSDARAQLAAWSGRGRLGVTQRAVVSPRWCPPGPGPHGEGPSCPPAPFVLRQEAAAQLGVTLREPGGLAQDEVCPVLLPSARLWTVRSQSESPCLSASQCQALQASCWAAASAFSVRVTGNTDGGCSGRPKRKRAAVSPWLLPADRCHPTAVAASPRLAPSLPEPGQCVPGPRS